MNGADLLAALLAEGWRSVGGQQGRYMRVGWPDEREDWILVPLDPAMADYDEYLQLAETRLRNAMFVGQAAGRALDRARDPGPTPAQPCTCRATTEGGGHSHGCHYQPGASL